MLFRSPGEGLPAKVATVEYLGAESLVVCEAGTGEHATRLVVRSPGGSLPRRGEAVGLRWPPAAQHAFNRASGRRICQPGAVDGEQIAAMARRNPTMVASRAEPAPMRRYDAPIDPRNDPFAWRGDYRRADTTGSIKPKPDAARAEAEDLDWVEDPGPRPQIDWSKDRHRPQ